MRTIFSATEVASTVDTATHLNSQIRSFMCLSAFGPSEDDLLSLARDLKAASDYADTIESTATALELQAFCVERAAELNNQYSFECAAGELYINDDLDLVIRVYEDTYLDAMSIIRAESRVIISCFITVASAFRAFTSGVSRLKSDLVNLVS